ncbi:DUF4255 domain-containing protein [Rhodovulum sp. DZ06]|uniref:DUF4255 domain-containing protein n=1 Tax=Rhodovulum sp. DZ06 TaxID=3425126 RepID=UPI003D34D087
MSIHFAIPATSFVLKSLLEARLKIAYGGHAPPPVSVAPPPPRAPAGPGGGGGAPEAAGLHLFLHHAGPNTALRNAFDPRVDAAGARVAEAPLALDLHYMLAASGADLEREALLGVGLAAFHRNGIVPRPMIEALLGGVAPPPGASFMNGMYAEPLADPAAQPQEMTISQQAVDVDLSTKLWSALQSPLRPCAFFLVTAIYLQSDDAYPGGKAVDTVRTTVRPAADPDHPAGETAETTGGAAP